LKENTNPIHSDLLVKYLLNEASSEDRLRVEQWITANSANLQYYEQYKLIWEESRSLSIPAVDEDAAWEKFLQRILYAGLVLQKTGAETTVRPGGILAAYRQAGWQWMRVAAIFILIAGLGYLLFNTLSVSRVTIRSQFRTRTDTLPDGSVVTLNKNSSLSYPENFPGAERNTQLQGEAFFNVLPDKSKPFLIHTNGIIIKVVGTSFNIHNRGLRTEIIVETGIVQITNPYHSILLNPHEKIILQKDDSVLRKETVVDRLYNYYRTQEFVCDHTPLWKLVETLNEAYQTHIVIKRVALLNLPLTTIFRNESLDNILEIIAKTFTITVIKSGDQIILE
jgi:transmembrane sensor